VEFRHSWHSEAMAGVDLVDETFIVVEPAVIAGIVAERTRWRQWWPDLELTVFMDRGLQGIRWSVAGPVVGSCEVWLEGHGDGVIVHYYLRVDPTLPGSRTERRSLPDSPRARRQLRALERRHAVRWKRTIWALKDELEAGRAPGAARAV
jgi:hypothetical protein